MKPRLFGTAVALCAALAVVTCKDDPTAALSGGATRILITPNPLFVAEGASAPFTATALNDALRGVASEYDATGGGAVASVVKDTTTPDPSRTTQRFTVTGLVPGQALITVTGAGLTETDTVNVLPLAFNGTASTASPLVGQPFTMYATSVIKFDASSQIRFGDRTLLDNPTAANNGIVTNQHPESLTVIVPQPEEAQPKAIQVSNVAVTFAPGNLFDLPTTDMFDVSNPWEPNDAPDPAAIVGAGTFYDGFAGSQVDKFYRITIPPGGASVTFLLEWNGGADVDILMCDAGCNNFIGNFGGATGANPEETTMDLPEGTHNLWINLYDGADDVPHLFKMTITFN